STRRDARCSAPCSPCIQVVLVSSLLVRTRMGTGPITVSTKRIPVEVALSTCIPRQSMTQPDPMFTLPNTIYGRFTDAFGRHKEYTGLVDPISLMQMVFFININGSPAMGDDCSIRFELNASAAADGILVLLPDDRTLSDIELIRYLLSRGARLLTTCSFQPFISDMAKLMIGVWKESAADCE
ncbi:hypothetical protein PFISCL1PPCAC_22323, partial [Pristionchus fissidentatus]